ncbi:MAG: 3-deoxy-manno-octulosonate cytidylyltransferase [Alphaproteobacteria bacterium]
MKPIIVIPARLASTRLPDKPLADIAGLPMIVHVLRRAEAAKVGPVLVACGDQKIVDTVMAAGGRAVMTDPELPSGSDRVYAALESFDPAAEFDVVVNLQGDLPTIDPTVIDAVLKPLGDSSVDVATLVTEISDEAERYDPNAVKAVVGLAKGETVGQALYFSRATVPTGAGAHYHHIGIYAFRREALRRFVDLPESVLEKREKLEQLRALEAGMRVDVALVDTIPDGVDTPADLERARKILEN